MKRFFTVFFSVDSEHNFYRIRAENSLDAGNLVVFKFVQGDLLNYTKDTHKGMTIRIVAVIDSYIENDKISIFES